MQSSPQPGNNALVRASNAGLRNKTHPSNMPANTIPHQGFYPSSHRGHPGLTRQNPHMSTAFQTGGAMKASVLRLPTETESISTGPARIAPIDEHEQDGQAFHPGYRREGNRSTGKIAISQPQEQHNDVIPSQRPLLVPARPAQIYPSGGPQHSQTGNARPGRPSSMAQSQASSRHIIKTEDARAPLQEAIKEDPRIIAVDQGISAKLTMWTPASQAVHHREVYPALKHDKANTHGEAGRIHAPRPHHNQITEPHLSDRNEYREPKSFQVKRYSQQCNHAVKHESPFDPENSDEFFLQGVAMGNEPNGGYPSIIDDRFTPPKERRSASEAIHAPNNPPKLRQSSIASPSMPGSGDNSSKMYDDDDDANLVLHLEEDDDALMDPASHDDAYDEMGSQQVQGKETWKDSQFGRLRPAATSLAEATIDTRSQIRNQDTASTDRNVPLHNFMPFAPHETFDNIATLVGQIDVTHLQQVQCRTAMSWGEKGDWSKFDEAIKYQQDINEQIKDRYTSLQDKLFDLLEVKRKALDKQKSMTQKYSDAGYDLRKQADGLKFQTRQYISTDKKRKV